MLPAIRHLALGALVLAAANPALADTRSFPLTGFDKVALSGSMDVSVRTGPGFSVVATGKPDELERLRITVEGGELRIGMKSGSWSGSSPDIAVSLPRLNGARISGSGDMVIDSAVSDSFALAVSGSGDLKLAAFRGGNMAIAISGSGDISVAGSCAAVKIAVSGSGDVSAGQLACKTADIAVRGSGNVLASASTSANVAVVGSGDVVVSGRAACTVSKTGSGNVRCGPGQ
jgi:hypothetical protein